jgi:hypothetical protein
MELLLNLVWMALTFGAFCAFLHKWPSSRHPTAAPVAKSLLALGCVTVLLFPIVSASDDLHPTQAVMEESSKRIQLNSLQLSHGHSAAPVLPALLVCVLLALMVAHFLSQPVHVARAVEQERVPCDGRSPPVFSVI